MSSQFRIMQCLQSGWLPEPSVLWLPRSLGATVMSATRRLKWLSTPSTLLSPQSPRIYRRRGRDRCAPLSVKILFCLLACLGLTVNARIKTKIFQGSQQNFPEFVLRASWPESRWTWAVFRCATNFLGDCGCLIFWPSLRMPVKEKNAQTDF